MAWSGNTVAERRQLQDRDIKGAAVKADQGRIAFGQLVPERLGELSRTKVWCIGILERQQTIIHIDSGEAQGHRKLIGQRQEAARGTSAALVLRARESLFRRQGRVRI